MKDEKIARAKAALPLPELMHRLGLGDHARKSALSPFRDERHPSFGIFRREDGCWAWKDFGTNETGDEIDFLAKHLSLSQAEAIRAYLEMAGIRPTDPAPRRGIKARLAHPPSQVGHPPAKAQVPMKPSPSPLAPAVDGLATPSAGPATGGGWPTWDEAVAHFPDHAAEVAQERGLSVEFLAQLNRRSLIGWVHGPAFPVEDDNGEVISAHFRYPRTNGERQRWDFAPRLRDLGARLTPLVIGDPSRAAERHVFESQWDMMSVMERWGWHLEQAEHCAWICTRGAGNGGMIEGLLAGDAPVFIWPQNDKPKAGGVIPSEEWFETVKSLCDGPNIYRCATPPPHKDVNDWVKAGATTDDLATVAAAGLVQKFALTIRSVPELRSMSFDDADNYLGDRVLAAGQPTTLLGPGAVGKSRLLMQMAICMITGRPFLEMTTWARGKRWLILQTENSNRRLVHDLNRMLASLHLTEAELELVERCLFIHTVENDRDALMLLEDPADYAQVDSVIQHFRSDFVVFDPLNTFTASDLNKDQDMRAVINAITKLSRRGDPNRVPFVVHHALTGKAGAAKATGWDKGSYGRNSKVLYAWTRSQMNLAPADPDDETRLVLVHGKSNNGKPFEDVGIRYDEEKGLYEVDPNFDPEEFRKAVGLASGSPRKMRISADDIAQLVDGNALTKAKLAKAIQAEHGCGRARAYEAIEEAERARAIRKPTEGGKARRADIYVVCEGET